MAHLHRRSGEINNRWNHRNIRGVIIGMSVPIVHRQFDQNSDSIVDRSGAWKVRVAEYTGPHRRLFLYPLQSPEEEQPHSLRLSRPGVVPCVVAVGFNADVSGADAEGNVERNMQAFTRFRNALSSGNQLLTVQPPALTEKM